MLKKMFAEGFGTFLIVLFGCGSAVLSGGKVGFLGISLAFGLAVVAGAYSAGPISGGHFNPAVTLALCLKRITPWRDFPAYVGAQCAGGIIGALFLLLLAMGNPNYSIATNGLGQNGYGLLSPMKFSAASGFLFEVLFTAIFVMVIIAVVKSGSKFGGLIIGLTLAVIHIVGIPVTGVSVNPARSLAPAFFVGGDAMGQLWLFILAPMLGGLFGAILSSALDLQSNNLLDTNLDLPIID
jgi:aquaporin Z